MSSPGAPSARASCGAVLVAAAAVAPLALALSWPQPGLSPSDGLRLDPTMRPLTVRSFAGAWALGLAALWFLLAYRSRRLAGWEVALVLAGTALALLRLQLAWALAGALVPALARQLLLVQQPAGRQLARGPELRRHVHDGGGPLHPAAGAQPPGVGPTGGVGAGPQTGLPSPEAAAGARAWLPVRPRVRMAHLWVLLALQATFLVPASTPIVLADIWWTLRSGAWMAEHQALLTLDPFTSAPPAFPQLNAQWLAQLLFHGLFRLGGLELVITANALAATAAFGLVVAAAYTLTGRLRLACAAGLLAYGLGFTNLGPRPQTLAYPLFGLYLFALARARAAGDRRWLWLLPPAMAVWANLHGSFALGLVLLASVTAGTTLETRSLRAARPFGLSLLAAFVAACLTPYGPGSLAYVLGIGTNTIIRDYVTEWAPSSLGSPEGVLFFASAVLAAALALRSPARLTASEWLLLAAFGWVGASSIRGVIWWGLVLGPVVARLAAPLLPRVRPTGRERPLLNLAIAALILASMVLALPWLKGGNPLLPADKRSLVAGDTPVAVAEFLRGQRFPGRMLSYQGWGGYFGWALWPQHQPFLDGRIELHPPEVWLDYLAIAEPDPDWQARLDRYAIGYLVLSVEHNGPLIQAVGGSPASWQVVYADRQAVVFVRK